MNRLRAGWLLLSLLLLCLAREAVAERVVGMSKVIYDQISSREISR